MKQVSANLFDSCIVYFCFSAIQLCRSIGFTGVCLINQNKIGKAWYSFAIMQYNPSIEANNRQHSFNNFSS